MSNVKGGASCRSLHDGCSYRRGERHAAPSVLVPHRSLLCVDRCGIPLPFVYLSNSEDVEFHFLADCHGEVGEASAIPCRNAELTGDAMVSRASVLPPRLLFQSASPRRNQGDSGPRTEEHNTEQEY